MQVPTATPVMMLPLAPLVVQIAGVFEVNTTGLPEAPPMADSVPMPPTLTEGTAPKLKVWLPLPMVMVCVAWIAAV